MPTKLLVKSTPGDDRKISRETSSQVGRAGVGASQRNTKNGCRWGDEERCAGTVSVEGTNYMTDGS